MASLIERIVEAWEDIPDWANESKAQAAIDIVLEEAAKEQARRYKDFQDDPTNLAAMFDCEAAIRAMKGPIE